MTHQETVIGEFSRQAETFNASGVANATGPLDELIDMADLDASDRWFDAACGPGIVARRLAPLVRAVHGVDLAPAMVEVARRESAGAGIHNVSFAVGDATASGLAAGSFDGGLSRLAIHHLPLPGRLFDELARIVRPGGKIVIADHIADEDATAAAWSQEIERLRDPSHWACLPTSRLRALGTGAGLALEAERLVTLELDFDDWLRRGSASRESRALVESALTRRPAAAACFQVESTPGGRVLVLRMWIGRWRR